MTKRNDKRNGKYDDDSIIPPLLSVEEMYALNSEDKSYDEPMSTEMLEDIRDRVNLIQTLIG